MSESLINSIIVEFAIVELNCTFASIYVLEVNVSDANPTDVPCSVIETFGLELGKTSVALRSSGGVESFASSDRGISVTRLCSWDR
jgi:hypothetical protein